MTKRYKTLFKELENNIDKVEKEIKNFWVDYYDFSNGKNRIENKKIYTYDNIKITIFHFEEREDKRVSGFIETKLFYNDNEIELNKEKAHKLIKLLKAV